MRLRTALAALPVICLFGAFVFANAGSAAPAGTANLKIGKSDSPDPVRVGSQLTYTIGVENLGPVPATGVTVTDNLPQGRRPGLGDRSRRHLRGAGREGHLRIRRRSKPVGVNYGGAQVTATIVVVPAPPGRSATRRRSRATRKTRSTANNKATASTRVLGAADLPRGRRRRSRDSGRRRPARHARP